MTNPPADGLLDLQLRFGKLVLGPSAQGGLRIISPIGWEAANIVTAPSLPKYKKPLRANKAIVEPLAEAMALATTRSPNYVIRTITCFEPRLKRENRQISTHAWGISVCINADTNPQTHHGGTVIRDIPDLFGKAFEEVGFTWGLHFYRPSPSHFQFCINY